MKFKLQQTSRRRFLRNVSALGGALGFGDCLLTERVVCGAFSGSPGAALPEGTAPEPIPLRHFPDRLHAYVWRNWSLVPASRLANVIRAPKPEVLRMGRAMGLGEPPRISREVQARSYITTIKRNWHILPYEQLLELLDWTPERLAYTLREDDFLYVKLGNLKPRCQPLIYRPTDERARLWEQESARILREAFPDGIPPADPPFAFVSRLSHPPSSPEDKPAHSKGLRFCYSYFALYGDPLMDGTADPYPEGYLERLAQAGVNGVWLQAVLSKLCRFPWDPSLSVQHEVRLKNLRNLVSKAKRHGIRVFLYLNEPRAMPAGFFEDHSALKGAPEGGYASLCTSVPEVQDFLADSVAAVCRAAPDLGGFFSITASENLTNCWSHGGGQACPRCRERRPAEVIAEVNTLFQRGIQRSGTSAQLIAWDWGWNDAWALEAIGRLPDGIALMSVSEWELPIERGGIKSVVGEYCMSAVGPGPRAKRHWQAARDRGLKAIAKIQAGNTWELAAVPYLPVLDNVARHAQNLGSAGVDAIMLSWTLGGFPSPNLEVVAETLDRGSAEEGMRHVAEKRFGSAMAPALLKAWRQFSAAFRQFPFHVGVLYSGPQQLGPANLLYAEPTGYHATMVGFPYDDLDAWRAVYPPEVFVAQFRAVADGFAAALEQLKKAASAAAPLVPSAQRNAFQAECGIAEAAALHFRGSANQAAFVMARRALAAAQTSAQAAPHKATIQRLLLDEITLARRLHELQSEDSRIGFEASNHYFYLPVDLAEKVLNCQNLLRDWLPRAGPK